MHTLYTGGSAGTQLRISKHNGLYIIVQHHQCGTIACPRQQGSNSFASSSSVVVSISIRTAALDQGRDIKQHSLVKAARCCTVCQGPRKLVLGEEKTRCASKNLSLLWPRMATCTHTHTQLTDRMLYYVWFACCRLVFVVVCPYAVAQRMRGKSVSALSDDGSRTVSSSVNSRYNPPGCSLVPMSLPLT